MSADAPHAIRKHSVTLAGHRTSLSLEAAFWDQLKRLADQRGLSLNRLIEEIDRARIADSPAANLSSAVRVYVLESLIAGSR